MALGAPWGVYSKIVITLVVGGAPGQKPECVSVFRPGCKTRVTLLQMLFQQTQCEVTHSCETRTVYPWPRDTAGKSAVKSSVTHRQHCIAVRCQPWAVHWRVRAV